MTTHVVTATREQVDWAIDMLDATQELIETAEDSGEPIEINDGAAGTFARANAILTAVSVTAFGLSESNALLRAQRADLLQALQAAEHALRSYQYGNGSPELAEEVVNHISAVIEAERRKEY